MNIIPRFVRRAWRSLVVWMGFVKPVVYEPDARLADVINCIVCSSWSPGGFIVAVETKQAMIKILSYMEKNSIAAVAATNLDLGTLRVGDLHAVLKTMRTDPEAYQVVVMFKHTAAVGWSVPREYQEYWDHVFMLSTFKQREPWRTQFNGRLRRVDA
jgi:hypothetical protein